ncbi:MAG: outer membrane lipoprotein chaperone LolA [Gammaproteobacteria bacterium]|nr:outer membrane lipoprotein chaperone LolA [Gammaproteobacteria bacterium]
MTKHSLTMPCAGLLMLLIGMGLHAQPIPAYVQDFFDDLTTLQADFDQQVTDANNRPIQSSQGKMWIMRPGRFRWNYLTPYKQQLVADGERLWSWDEDLEQVTVQQAGDVLTATPAMLLGGGKPLTEVFSIEEIGTLTVLLTPKTDDSNIDALRLVFSGDQLTQIVAHDSFGNITQFNFTNMQRNLQLAPDLFRFVPPAGADVVGDTQ